MCGSGVIGLGGEDFLQDGGGLALVGVGFIREGGRAQQRQRVKRGDLLVLRKFCRELFHVEAIRHRARAMVAFSRVGVEVSQRGDEPLLALRPGAGAHRLRDRCRSRLQRLGVGQVPERTPVGHGFAPIGHSTLGVLFGDCGEFTQRFFVSERVQQRHRMRKAFTRLR